MRKTLIVLATAGVLGAGAAAAGTTIRHDFGSAFVPVQYTERHDYRSDDRWDDRSQNINEREARIRALIQRGVQAGRLTGREARELNRDLASVEAREHNYMVDGRLSYREDADLKRSLDRLADNLRAQLRDEDRRYSYNR